MYPNSIQIDLLGPLTVDLDASDRLARTQDRLHDLFYLVSSLEGPSHGPTAHMAFNRNAANFRHVLIDHHVAAVGAEKGEADRCGPVYRLQFW